VEKCEAGPQTRSRDLMASKLPKAPLRCFWAPDVPRIPRVHFPPSAFCSATCKADTGPPQGASVRSECVAGTYSATAGSARESHDCDMGSKCTDARLSMPAVQCGVIIPRSLVRVLASVVRRGPQSLPSAPGHGPPVAITLPVQALTEDRLLVSKHAGVAAPATFGPMMSDGANMNTSASIELVSLFLSHRSQRPPAIVERREARPPQLPLCRPSSRLATSSPLVASTPRAFDLSPPPAISALPLVSGVRSTG
jgi:hypothetical protein